MGARNPHVIHSDRSRPEPCGPDIGLSSRSGEVTDPGHRRKVGQVECTKKGACLSGGWVEVNRSHFLPPPPRFL